MNLSNYNLYLEGIRALQGQDDELDDELRIIWFNEKMILN